MTVGTLVTCFYCGKDKPRAEFSDEHIWPDALGGNHLSQFWRTDDVCASCNSMSGIFVDGGFICGWAGSAERGMDVRQYLSLTEPLKTVLPLNYFGRLTHDAIQPDEAAEWWEGPCGATVVHFRPTETEEIWTSYLGGDPRAKKRRAGRAYIALASQTEYWIISALEAFKKHFERAQRYIVNTDVPVKWKSFSEVDRNDPMQAADLQVIDMILAAGKAGDLVRAQLQLRIDTDHRFLCKLGLAIGCKLFGSDFGNHAQGAQLRKAFRDPDPVRRKQIPIRGSGYFGGPKESPLAILGWPAAWVLIVKRNGDALGLTIVSPSGKLMAIQITEDPSLFAALGQEYVDGLVWVTVPPLGKAAGPILMPDYAAHLIGEILHPELSALAAPRIDPATLPAC